jgi:hypothetical protein
LLETDLVESPALYGLFRLRLLLPPKLSERFTPDELRHIFLHELSHVRRHNTESKEFQRSSCSTRREKLWQPICAETISRPSWPPL